jgi:hypothetical protein
MRKKIVFGIMLGLLLANILTLAFSTQPVKAQGAIYIKADGSIDPTALIHRNKETNRYPLMTPQFALIGDVNRDDKVDIKDLVLLIKAFGSYPNHPRWNPNADINGDNKIDIEDLVLLVEHFGEHYPEPARKYVGITIHPSGGMREHPSSYWVNATKYICSKFSDAQPIVVWIVGVISGSNCSLSFPSPGGSYPNITFSSTDKNENYLDAFDAAGIKVWLTVEPSDADVETLITLVFDRYKYHSCLTGFGIDIEWYKSLSYPEGKPVTYDEATTWLAKIKSYNSNYRLRLVHWQSSKMPSPHPSDVMFIDDAQGFSDLDAMVSSFKRWGNTFYDGKVGFSVGFPKDRSWWSQLQDPAGTIIDRLFDEISNCKEVYWVCWSITDIYP